MLSPGGLAMTILFWSVLFLVVYTYLIYPLIIFFRGLFFRESYTSGEVLCKVSLVIAAHNEARSIGKKLDNLLDLNFPKDRLEVIIASDGSTDGTNDIVSGYSRFGFKLLALPRLGKADALNAAVAASSGEILVFSDANSMFAPESLHALVGPFADPRVGGVAGNQCYLGKKGSDINRSEHSYWNFDRLMKKFQSMAGNTISATGAIYAIRRSLFIEVPIGVTDDFVTSTRVIAQRYRLVFAPDAVAYEPAAESNSAEFARKVRIMTRGLQGVLVMRQLLNPFKYGFYAIELFSHKVLRRLVVFPLLVLAFISPFLWNQGLFYQITAIGQAVFYSVALLGFFLRKTSFGRNKLLALPFFFCSVYTAALIATFNILRGRKIIRWEPNRQVKINATEKEPRAPIQSDGKIDRVI
jgi:cellulose synthase/poly-beta-1,6-N-acetylglucosamine synthase-like glycosyltransferase